MPSAWLAPANAGPGPLSRPLVGAAQMRQGGGGWGPRGQGGSVEGTLSHASSGTQVPCLLEEGLGALLCPRLLGLRDGAGKPDSSWSDQRPLCRPQGGLGSRPALSPPTCVSSGTKRPPCPVFPLWWEREYDHILAGPACPSRCSASTRPHPSSGFPLPKTLLRGTPPVSPSSEPTPLVASGHHTCIRAPGRDGAAFCPGKAQGGQACPVGQERDKHRHEDSGVSDGRAVGGPVGSLHPLLPPSCLHPSCALRHRCWLLASPTPHPVSPCVCPQPWSSSTPILPAVLTALPCCGQGQADGVQSLASTTLALQGIEFQGAEGSVGRF